MSVPRGLAQENPHAAPVGDSGKDQPGTDETREDEESVHVRDDRVHAIVEEEESSRESVESIGEIYAIRHRDDDEDEEWDIEPPELDPSKERNMESRIPELRIKPPRADPREDDEREHLDAGAEPLGATDTADIHVVVHESDESDGEEGEEREVGLAAIPEGVVDGDTRVLLDPRATRTHRDGDSDEDRDDEEDDPRTHARCTRFFFVELGEEGCFAHECLLADMLAETVAIEESDIRGNAEEREEEGEYEVREEKVEISHRMDEEYMPAVYAFSDFCKFALGQTRKKRE